MTKMIKGDAEASISKEKYDALQREYDEFIYMVSHDLGAPMRHIKGFTQILVNNLDEEDLNNNQDIIDVIQKAATKSQDMMDALLTLSRIHPTDEGLAPYDLNNALSSAKKRLRGDIDAVNAVITSAPLPSVLGYWPYLNDLFFYILSNAIKFQPKGQAPVINITHEHGQTGSVIHFIDNGVGIPPHNYDDVFTMFRRLNHADEYNGVGAGLAYCRKIMSLHDGKIDVDQTDDKQTRITVYFPG